MKDRLFIPSLLMKFRFRKKKKLHYELYYNPLFEKLLNSGPIHLFHLYLRLVHLNLLHLLIWPSKFEDFDEKRDVTNQSKTKLNKNEPNRPVNGVER